ncbi:VAMP-associated protein [Auriscalpium vulgare]|uniref:VAMP-associated protein n=1 Tax=Auriscalpium vulgare TaxID=40419 RepID=A0ACB8SA60_9AGAM|nr:VAMP-associated protein [Auriscalpium vulgare]
MSASLTPSSALGFNRPLTQNIKRSLSITNPNAQPIAFKVKTTAPKLYCVRPNSGRVEPGETVEVSVMLQAMKEEPPLNIKCKDKFLIQSTLIAGDRAALPLHDIWSVPETDDLTKVHSQKIKVSYLPPEGQAVEEEDELPNQSSIMSGDESNLRYGTVKQAPSGTAGEHTSILDPSTSAHVERPVSPPLEYAAAPEEQPDVPAADKSSGGVGVINVNVHSPPTPPTVSTAALVAPADPNVELVSKYKESQAEIQRLRSLLAAVPDPSSVASSGTSPTEIRRRYRPRDDDATVVDSEVSTYADDILQPEGVPLQVVVIIALLVFITTYLFF